MAAIAAKHARENGLQFPGCAINHVAHALPGPPFILLIVFTHYPSKCRFPDDEDVCEVE